MNLRLMAAWLVLVTTHASATSQPVTLHCRYFDPIKKDGSFLRSLDQFIVVDTANQTVMRNGKLIPSKWTDEDVRTERESESYDSEPVIVGFDVMVFKRQTGAFASFTQYRTKDGRNLYGEELQRMAKAKGVWEESIVPGGIHPPVVWNGKCVVAEPKIF